MRKKNDARGERGVTISEGVRSADPAEAAALYIELGWGTSARYSSMRMKKALEGCDVVISAHNSAGELVGLLRALTDSTLDTKVLDLVVAPEYQRQGIGVRMMDRLARHPRVRGTTVYFETERRNFGFAAKCGYAPRKGLTVFSAKNSVRSSKGARGKGSR